MLTAPRERFELPWLPLYLVAVASLHCAAYLGFPALPGNNQEYPLGWWGWWDQSQYLKSAQAFAVWNLSADQHWYPLAYPILGAVFVKALPMHAFFFVDLTCFVALAWLLVLLSRRLGLGDWAGVGAFVVGVLASKTLLTQYVIPWTTTPVVALLVASFVLHLLGVQEGFSAPLTAALAALVAAVAAFRPVEVLPLIPVVVHVAWILLHRAARERCRRDAMLPIIAGALGGTLVLAAYAALHVAIYGWRKSPYMGNIGDLGLDPAIIPFRAFVLLLNPRPFYGVGEGVVERYPLFLVGLWGLAYAMLFVASARVIGAAVLIALVSYLAFVDFLPSGIWTYHNIHYWKWLFPLLGLLALVAARHALNTGWRRALGVAIAFAPLAFVHLDARVQPPIALAPQGAHSISLNSLPGTPITALRLTGVEGGETDVYLGTHFIETRSHRLRHFSDFRLVRVAADDLRLVFTRPVRLDGALLQLDERVVVRANPEASALEPRLALRWPWRASQSEVRSHAAPSLPRLCKGEESRPVDGSHGEFVHQTYRALLGREPDETGFRDNCSLLTSGKVSRQDVVQGIKRSAEYRARNL